MYSILSSLLWDLVFAVLDSVRYMSYNKVFVNSAII